MKPLRALFLAQRGCCHYCGVTMMLPQNGGAVKERTATIDHATPIARGGLSNTRNRVAACYRCNNAKGPLTAAEFMSVREDPHALYRLVQVAHERLRQPLAAPHAEPRRGRHVLSREAAE